MGQERDPLKIPFVNFLLQIFSTKSFDLEVHATGLGEHVWSLSTRGSELPELQVPFLPSFLHCIPRDPGTDSSLPTPHPMGHENQFSFLAPHNSIPCQGGQSRGHRLGTAAHLSHIIWPGLEGDGAGQVGGNLGREREKKGNKGCVQS